MAGIGAANAIVMIFLFVVMQKKFYSWDQNGGIRMTAGEIGFIIVFFFLASMLMAGKMSVTTSIMLSLNLVCLTFSAITDYKTGMLYKVMLYVPLTFNWLIFAAGSLAGAIETVPGSGGAAAVYAVAAVILCLTKAIAAGDGIIYFILLPVMLMIEQNDYERIIILLFLSLMIPLLVFDLVEGSRMIFKWVKTRRTGGCKILRRPFAPYILGGFVLSLLLGLYAR